MLGTTLLSWVGLLDLSLVYLSPTYLVPQIIGGLILGAGFVVGGYCPGTSVVAAATGRLDGLMLLLGALAGTLLFAEAYPLVRSVHQMTPMGPLTLPGYFNLPHGLVVAAVVLMAVGGFVGAAWVEKWQRSRSDELVPTPSTTRSTNRRLAFAALVLGAILLPSQPMRAGRATVDASELAVLVERGADQVKPRDLADWIISGRPDYRLIDVRDAAAFAAYRIPTAENVPISQLGGAGLLRNEKLVLYGDDGVKGTQAWFLLRALGYRGAYVLAGGLDAWKREVLFPRLLDGTGPEVERQNDGLRAMSTRFGGKVLATRPGVDAPEAEAALPAPPPAVAMPSLPAGAKAGPKKRREGC
jgi:rhodanese-related sulfurtransferase